MVEEHRESRLQYLMKEKEKEKKTALSKARIPNLIQPNKRVTEITTHPCFRLLKENILFGITSLLEKHRKRLLGEVPTQSQQVQEVSELRNHFGSLQLSTLWATEYIPNM